MIFHISFAHPPQIAQVDWWAADDRSGLWHQAGQATRGHEWILFASRAARQHARAGFAERDIMAGSGFLPDTDAGLLAWSLNFKTLITATPTAFGLTSALATSYGTLHDAYASALAAA